MTVADNSDDSTATIADNGNGGIRLLTYVTAYAGGRIPPFVVATACPFDQLRMPRHTPYAKYGNARRIGTSNHPITHAAACTTRHIRQRPPPSSPFRLNHACQDIHDGQNTPDASDTPDNPQHPPPTTHNPKPQQERPAAGIQPTTGLRPINALPPRGMSITEFATQKLTARRFSDRCRRRPRPPPDRRRGRRRCAAHAPRHRAGRAGPKPRCGFRTWKSSAR